MNILIDELPTTVTIDGKVIPIKSDFKTSLKFSIMLENEEAPERRLYKTLQMFYPNRKFCKNHVESALKQALSFYSGGKTEEARSGKRQSSTHGFSFSCDAELIYSAFLQVYGIDLQTVNMHWWRFLALFRGLPDCKFTQIVGIRTMDTSRMSKDMRQHYEQQKRIWALPLTERQKAMQSEIEQALLKGENVSEILANYRG